jgi:hypothetical protein
MASNINGFLELFDLWVHKIGAPLDVMCGGCGGCGGLG